MRTLIDGYNLMYALGLLGKRHGPDGFRKVRTRFLNDLAGALGAIAARTRPRWSSTPIIRPVISPASRLIRGSP